MRKAIAPTGIAVLAVLAVTATSNASFAQAGSTGGTIGKMDKSLSGEQREEAPAQTHPTQSRARANAEAGRPSNAACKLAAVWANEIAGLGSSVWTITADGTATEQGLGRAHGHAVLSGHGLRIAYSTLMSTGNYVVQLNQTCTGGSGETTVVSGYAAGTVRHVTFTAAPATD
jgi:hypothetical protein